MLGAWVIHVTTFTDRTLLAAFAIRAMPRYLVAGTLSLLYLGAVVTAVRPRTWQAEDELHEQEIGKDR